MKGLAIILALTFSAAVFSFSASLTVKVNDGRIGLEDVSLSIPEIKANLISDERGIAVFKNIQAGPYTLYAVLPGYEKYSNTIEMNGENTEINIRLKPSTYSLGEINVESKRNRGKVSSQTTVKQDELEANSQGLVNDSFRTLQLMPGVSSGAGAMDSTMYIEGGNSTEWLASMDGILIPDPVRWGSVFTISMFNPYTVDSIDLYTAGYPASYGQGLSGIIVVDTINGSRDRWKGFIDISAIEAEVLVEGPVTSNLTVMFDMRRTFYDLYVPLITGTENSGVQYPYLWDGILKIGWDITPSDKITFDAYGSLEGLRWILTADTNAPQTGGNLSGTFEYRILNIIGSARYTHQMNAEDSFDIVAGATPSFGYDNLSQNQSFSSSDNWGQYIYQLSTDYFLNSIAGHKIQAGAMMFYCNPLYASVNDSQYMLTPQGQWTNFQNQNFNIPSMQAEYYGVYLMDNWEIIPSFIIELGGREEYWSLNSEYAFSPQAGIKYECTKELDFYLRGGLYHSFPLSVFDLYSSTGNPDLQSQKVYHAITGAEYADQDYMFRMEGFYKYYFDLDESDSLLNINNTGLRNVYGGDIYLQKKARKGDWLSGWVSYTYVNGLEEITNRSPEDPNNPYIEPLNQLFVPDYLRSHTISAVIEMTYYKNPDHASFLDFLNGWIFTAQLTAMSGVPYTPVTNFVSASVGGQGTQYYFLNGGYDSQFTPWYVRLDLILKIPFSADWLKGFFGPDVKGYTYIEVINALNNDNVLSYSYMVVNGQLSQVEDRDLGIIPLAGFRLEF